MTPGAAARRHHTARRALAIPVSWRLIFSTAFMVTGNTTLQLTADPQFRGRVMALWSVTFTGSTPIGGPIVG